MGFNSAFKGLKLLKKPGNGRLNNLNSPVLNVLECFQVSPDRPSDTNAIKINPYPANVENMVSS